MTFCLSPCKNHAHCVSVVMSKKVLEVEALVLNKSCFTERLFAPQYHRNLDFSIFSFIYVIFLRRFADPLMETAAFKRFSMSPLIGCRLKFQTDQYLLLKAEVCAKCQQSNEPLQ